MAVKNNTLGQSAAGIADDAWYEGSSSSSSSSSSCSDMAGMTPHVPIPEQNAEPSRSTFLDLPPALIAEVFKHLDARELSMISCVCSLFRGLSSDSHGWKNFYCERWGSPAPSSSNFSSSSINSSRDMPPMLSEKAWKDLYLAREARSKAFLGRSQNNMMVGHTKAIRCVRMLPLANLVFTAGYDSILRIWDLEESSLMACSRPLGGDSLRAIAVDMSFLAVGGTDSRIRIWREIPNLLHRFDVAGIIKERGRENSSMIELVGHEGPITSLSLDGTRICSGSWDMTVKVWDCNTFSCIRTLNHCDWVWSISLRSQRLFSASGSDLYSWDVETGECSRVRRSAHEGHVYAVECSRSGHFLFSGGEDGIIKMYENTEEASNNEPVAFWHPHSGAVYALAFEDPWLVSSSADGSLAMIDIRKIIVKRGRGPVNSSLKSKNNCHHQMGWAVISTDAERPQRMLFCSNQSLYSVDVGADRIVTAGLEQIVRVWDFSRALEMEQRVQESRSVRLEQRMKRKNQKGKQGKQVCNMAENRDGGMEVLPVWRRGDIKVKA